MSLSISTALPAELVSVQAAVTDILLSYCAEQQQRAHRMAPAYGRLWHAIGQQISHGGKRLRPYLCLTAYQAYGGRHYQAGLHVAAAWELLHIGLLVHDDIIDRDYIRHGQPNIAGEYLRHYEGFNDDQERRHAAHSAALLGGDLLLSAANDLVLRQETFGAEQRIHFVQALHDALYEVGGGELLDSEAAFQPVVAVNPELIATHKTASYSFIGPLLSGAALAGGAPKDLQALRQYGLALGVGYQLADDLLGTFGKQATTGKPDDSDLREAKRSAVLVQGLAGLSGANRERAEAILGGPLPLAPAQVTELRTLLEQSDARLQIESRLDALADTARHRLAELKLATPYHQTLDTLIKQALHRER